MCSCQDFLLREGEAREVYPAEVDRWYGFLYENLEHVSALVRWGNELAARHDLSPMLRPLVATPIMLKMRDDEMAVLEREATEKAGVLCLIWLGKPCVFRRHVCMPEGGDAC